MNSYLNDLARMAESMADEIDALIKTAPEEDKGLLMLIGARLRTSRLTIELAMKLGAQYDGNSLLATELTKIHKLLSEIKSETKPKD